MKKLIAIICGGRSAEHEVSLQSAKSVIEAMDREKFNLMIIGITKHGEWQIFPENDYLQNHADPAKIALSTAGKVVAIVPGTAKNKLFNLETNQFLPSPQAVFSILHGPYGEDGTMQGLLKLMDLPFVGPSVLGSAVSMDKDLMKKLMTLAQIPNADFFTFINGSENPDFKAVEQKLGLPVFIKPANMG